MPCLERKGLLMVGVYGTKPAATEVVFIHRSLNISRTEGYAASCANGVVHINNVASWRSASNSVL